MWNTQSCTLASARFAFIEVSPSDVDVEDYGAFACVCASVRGAEYSTASLS